MMDLLVYIHDVYCNDIMCVVLERINSSNYDDLSDVIQSIQHLKSSIENLHIDDEEEPFDIVLDNIIEDICTTNDRIHSNPELASIFNQLIYPNQCKHGYEVFNLCKSR